MEIPEEPLGSVNTAGGGGGSSNGSDNNNEGCLQHAVVKGKRTKRQRTTGPMQAPPATATATSSASSSEVSGSATEEEEDMANCLILLAQGRALGAWPKPESLTEEEAGGGKLTTRRFAEAATTTTNVKAGFYVYECKTCNKCFPSFQALGGHRASHKRPKISAAPPATGDEERKPRVIDEDSIQISMNSFAAATIISPANNTTGAGNTKTRVHECSICGAEFSSGQALGGHMRRHRPISLPENSEAKKERTLLSLDLNLPAPSDDDHRMEFSAAKSPAMVLGFAASKQPLTFSASALVDCHY